MQQPDASRSASPGVTGSGVSSVSWVLGPPPAHQEEQPHRGERCGHQDGADRIDGRSDVDPYEGQDPEGEGVGGSGEEEAADDVVERESEGRSESATIPGQMSGRVTRMKARTGFRVEVLGGFVD